MDLLTFTSPLDPSSLRDLAATTRKLAEKAFVVTPPDKPAFRREDFIQMANLGLAGAALPETVGGINASRLEVATIHFELARVQLGCAIYLSVHHMVTGLIAKWGLPSPTPTLEGTLAALASGEHLGAFCLTEAQAGSDAAALRTRAERTPTGYRLNGEKIYITSGGYADLYLVFARTSDDPKRGISAFLVPKATPGLSFGPPERKMGCEGSPITTVTFQGVELPATALLAQEGDGYRIALSGLAGGRANIAAAACGLASRALELGIHHLKERKQFGHPLAEFQGLRFMVAEMFQHLRASVVLTRDAVNQLDSGLTATEACAIAKCFATDAAMKITTDAVQLLGGAGYLEDYQVERLMRDAKMLQIVEGTNQIQRLVIARALLGE